MTSFVYSTSTMAETATDLLIIMTVLALIPVLHVFGGTQNVNKREESNIQTSREELDAAAL